MLRGVILAILWIEVQIISDEQIQPPIAVVIDKRRSRPEERIFDARLRRHIAERSVAVVVVQNRGVVVGDVQILIAIVVKVAGCHADAKTFSSDTRSGSHVGKRSVAIVAVQMIRRALAIRRGVIGDSRQISSADHIQIEQTVVVVIDPGAAGSRAFQDRTQILFAERLTEIDSRFLRHIFKLWQRGGRSCRRRSTILPK